MGDLELQRLKAVADAARVVRKAADTTGYYGTEADRSDYTIAMDMSARVWEALTEALKVLDKGGEVAEMEYDDGPWASTESDSCVDVAGYWHFPGPDVKDKVKPPIRIVALKQGFLVAPNVFEGYADDDLAFTDVVDLADWLLEWLGLKGGEYDRAAVVGLARSARGIHKDHGKVLDVAEAARAFVEYTHPPTFDALKEAVKKWRGIEGG